MAGKAEQQVPRFEHGGHPIRLIKHCIRGRMLQRPRGLILGPVLQEAVQLELIMLGEPQFDDRRIVVPVHSHNERASSHVWSRAGRRFSPDSYGGNAEITRPERVDPVHPRE